MSLQFNVSLLAQEDTGSIREHAIDSRLLVSDRPSHGRVVGDVRMLRTIDGILVSAELAGELEEQCSRCLEALNVPIKLEIEEEFVLSADPVSGAILQSPEDPDVFRVGPTHILDMEEAVRQSWMSALPIQSLCRETCAGLCADCGQNLNEQACDCQPNPDARWGALQELANELKGT